MSSSLIVEVCAVEEIIKHPNADKVELVRVKNWIAIAGIGQFKVGDKCVYVPPDCVIPEQLAERWGISKYCPPLPRGIDGQRPPGCRIKAQRFRGERSFGTVQKVDDETWPVGMSVVDHYLITKYEPPMRCTDGDSATPIHAFHPYTSIENINNFPTVIQPGEEVVISEKIHGTNWRGGYVLHPNEETGVAEWQWVAGSHGQRRKEFNSKGVRSMYWFPFKTEGADPLKDMLYDIQQHTDAKQSVVVFGEIFGPGVQDMQYGQKGLSYRVFDIAVDGKYLDFNVMKSYCEAYGVQMVPYLCRGPFSLEMVAEMTDGPTTICDPAEAGKFKGREGVVIRPVKERYSPDLPNYGRVVLKSVSVDYYERKGGTEYH
jgi:RNA ligase (TIGR02306 family)